MKNPACGRCNFQGSSRIGETCAEVLCLIDGQWHPDSYSCKHWSEYASNLSAQQRSQLAIARRSEEDAERRHRETLEHLARKGPPINITLSQSQNQTQVLQQTIPSSPQLSIFSWGRVGKWFLRHLVEIIVGVVILIIGAWALPRFGPSTAPVQPLTASMQTPHQLATIEFGNGKPFVERAVWGDDQTKEYWNVYYFQVEIQNISETTIHAKRVMLTNLQHLEDSAFKPWEDAQTVSLAWPATIDKKISPQEKILIPFARIFPVELQKREDVLLSGDINIPQLRFTVWPWPRVMTSHIPPGTHRFKLIIYFENAPPAEALLELEWLAKQPRSPETMLQEIRIRKIGTGSLGKSG